MKVLLDEQFKAADCDARLRWLHPPPRWASGQNGRRLVVAPQAETDFWQRTHYGFSADNGHFLGLPVPGDFTMSTAVRFRPAHQYDQAGLMIRSSADFWVKTSVEHELQGPPQLGVVITHHGYSDWSLQDFEGSSCEVRLRLEKRGSDLSAFYQPAPETPWKPLRVAHWHGPPDQPIWAGLYACSPKGAGFEAEFESLQITVP